MSKLTFAAGLKSRHHMSARQAMITAKSQVHSDAGASKAPAEVQGTETIINPANHSAQSEAASLQHGGHTPPKPV